jgi:hypothetical protein
MGLRYDDPAVAVVVALEEEIQEGQPNQSQFLKEKNGKEKPVR